MPMGQYHWISTMISALTPMQMTNWHMLLSLVSSAKDDLIGTCCAYRLERDVAQRLVDMTPGDLMTVVINAGDDSLFHTRSDLSEILALPRALSGTMMTVKQPVPMRSQPLSSARSGAAA